MDETLEGVVVTPFNTVADEEDAMAEFNALQNSYLNEEQAIVPTVVKPLGTSNIVFEQYEKDVLAKAEAAKAQVQTEGVRSEVHLASLYGRESNPNKGENYLHSGLEGKGKTSQYGVRQKDFPLQKGETYKQQAARVLSSKLHTVERRTPAFKEASNELQASLVPVLWNLGENSGAIRKFDYGNVKLSAARIMQYYKYTPQGKKEKVPSKGLMNARIKDWNAIATTPEGIDAGMSPITKYEEYKQQV